jgi:hypothetical protein
VNVPFLNQSFLTVMFSLGSCPYKIKGPDARIAIAMPPRIGTNIMMVMRESIEHTIRTSRH